MTKLVAITGASILIASTTLRLTSIASVGKASEIPATLGTTVAIPNEAGARTNPAVQSGYAPVNGLKIYYEVHGEAKPNTVPLVLLHGGGSTIETSFDKVLPLFAKSRRVIAFEQQGHGRTGDIADRPFTFEQSADDAAALLKHLKVEQADLYGYSNGGSIALQLAIRYPKLVRKIIAAAAMYKRDGFGPEFWESMKQAKLESMPAELRDAYLKVAPNPNNLQSFHDKCVARMLEFKDWPADQIKGIDAPTMILIGDADVIRPEHAVEMFRLLPHGQLAIVPGTDHMALVKRADLLLPIISQFLEAPMPQTKTGERHGS